MSITVEVRTNCLASKKDVGNDYLGQRVLISGWGRHGDGQDGNLDQQLRFVDNVPVISDKVCGDAYGGITLNPGVICINTAGGHGSCSVSLFYSVVGEIGQ
jgi:hypothetical protein